MVANRGSLVFEIMLVLSCIVAVGNLPLISAQCGSNFTLIFEECKEFIRREGPHIEPSKDCCETLQGNNITCSCEIITPGIEERNDISLDKTVYVSRACGNYIEPGTNCGAYTIPPESSPVPEE